MNRLLFALKRTVRSAPFLVLLVLTLFLPYLMDIATRDTEPRGGVFFREDPASVDPDSRRLEAYLEEEGFTAFEGSYEALEDALSEGRYDAAVIVPARLSEKLSSGNAVEALTVRLSPVAYHPSFWKGTASAALYAVYAPHVTVLTLDGTGIPEAEIYQEYEALMGAERLFSFEITRVSGAALKRTERQDRFFMGTLAILVYLAGWFGIVMPLKRDRDNMALRITGDAATRAVFVPGVLLRAAVLYVAAAVPGIVSGRAVLLVPLLLYEAAVLGVHLLLSLLPGRDWKDIAVILLSMAALALCPMYTDFSLTIPAVAVIRLFIPAYWLWLFRGLFPY